MFKINLKGIAFKGMDGKVSIPTVAQIAQGAESGQTYLHKVIGTTLCNMRDGDSAKLNSLGLRFYNEDSIDIDEADMEFVLDSMEKAKHLTASMRAQCRALVKDGKELPDTGKKKTTGSK